MRRATIMLSAGLALTVEAQAQPGSRPVVTSPTTASAAENAAGVVYNATATDPDGDPIAYSIAFGFDGARFRIDPATGGLSFRIPPDFEIPSDANADNVYRLTIRARDGRGGVARRALRVTVANLIEGYQVRRRGAGFTLPLFISGSGDGSGRVFVVEKGGLIRILNPETGAINAAPFLDISGAIGTDGERGLLGLAFAPDYATSRVFYVHLSSPLGPTEIWRFRTSADPNVADAASGDAILSFAHPSNNHRSGWIGFGPDGFLYIASGDADLAVDAANPAQDATSLLGKLLRIDVSADGFPSDPARDYRIPASNPFAGGGGLPEIYATGLRNPYRGSFDAVTGALLIGDVGEASREEINLIAPGDAGRNFGWARFEGTFIIVPDESAPNATPPVIEYLHGLGPFEGRTVIGGVVNRGPVGDLRGHYIFGDFISDNIWSVPLASIQQGATLSANAFTRQTDAFAPDAGTIESISSFGTDDAGNVYIVDLFGGEIFRLENQ
ncbi:MAG: PQQ-dependent sugar dehydrogenase [Parvularculaceae bacterium]